MPGGGSQGWAFIAAREEASSSHPRLLFMACGVTRRPRAGTRASPAEAAPRRLGKLRQPPLVQRRMNPPIRNLRRATDPLFQQAGMSLDDG